MAGSGSGRLRGRSGGAGGEHGLAAGGWEKWRGGAIKDGKGSAQ